MDITKSSIYKLPLHEHPLFPTAKFTETLCDGCHEREGYTYCSYYCNEVSCKSQFHKECAEAPLEINHHSYHPEHPLLLMLTNKFPTKNACDFCGKYLFSPYYTCRTCEFKVDIICGLKPSLSSIEQPVCHDHPLVLKKLGEEIVLCEVCKESIGGPSYSCQECNNVYIHSGCVGLSKEVNHPCHPNHPLKIIDRDSLEDDHAETNCRLCSVELEHIMLYHCSICNFTLCLGCKKIPPPLVIDYPKTHTHPLRLVASKLAFMCTVCGIEGYDTKPYICLMCNFFVHRSCIGLPQVININRHDHRISFTHHLGRRGTKCGVCRGNVSQYHGAYFCSVCPKYTVHTRCAVNDDVWNGVELEGTPESSEDIAPFKVVGHNLIRHFSHSEHTFRLLKNKAIDESIRCEACIGPVGVGMIYSCEACCFVLHESCAKLPMKKRLVFDPLPYKLVRDNEAIYCNLCGMLCAGFKYTLEKIASQLIDVHCSSVSDPFVHNAHLHPLYFSKKKDRYCLACKRVPDDYMLACYACEFYLCLYCVTLPKMIWRHMSDEHPIFLSYDGEKSGKNWCDICESELDPSEWFYTCTGCEVAFHVQCVIGDFSRLKPERVYNFGVGGEYKVVLNNRNTRPLCSHCHSRCKVPVILVDSGKDNGYICSLPCLNISFI